MNAEIRYYTPDVRCHGLKILPHKKSVVLKSLKLSLLRMLLIGCFICMFGVLYLMFSIYTYSFESEDVTTDAAIILGAAVWKDSPSPVFKERIKHAINLYKNGKVRYLIFTGGFGNGEKFAESEVAKAYAIRNGIPNNSIFIETSSKITFDNLKESKKIMDKQRIHSVLIVSDPLHMKRAITMAKDLGMVAYTSPTPTSQYKTWKTKFELLSWETSYYIGHLIMYVSRVR